MHKRMGVTVREILQQDFFRDARVLCGQGGIDRNITGVNVMEVPDIVNWIKPYELLLTTAYSIRDDLLKLNHLIPAMKQTGVAALGIKTKRYVDDLPASVLETADALDFPIIRIPIDLSFGEIISQVLTQVVNNQTTLLMQIDGFNNQVKTIMLKGGGINEIARMITDVVRAPVAITDDLFKDYTIASDPGDTSDFHRVIGSILNRRTEKVVRHQDKLETFFEVDTVRGETVRRIMIPIFSHNILYGHVVVWDMEGRVTDAMLHMIESAISLIALNSSKKMSIYENENKHRIEFIEGLLSDEESRRVKALDKAAYFEFKPERAHGVMVVSIDETRRMHSQRASHTDSLKQLNDKLVRAVERLNHQYSGRLVYGQRNDEVLFLLATDLETDPAGQKEQMIQLGSDMMVCARMENLHKDLTLGLGRVYGEHRDLHRSYREAQKAIQKMELNPGPKRMMHFDDLGLFRILSHDALHPELRQFFVEVLGPIVAYDREKNTDLLETLRVYYACGGNLKKVATAMHTHYNTVIYRMQRIREIGNLDLSDPEDTLNAQIALKMLDVIRLDSITDLGESPVETTGRKRA